MKKHDKLENMPKLNLLAVTVRIYGVTFLKSILLIHGCRNMEQKSGGSGG